MRKLLFAVPLLVVAAVGLFAVGMGGAHAGPASTAGVTPNEVAQDQANACEGGKKVDGAGTYDLKFNAGTADEFTIHLVITTTPRDVGGPYVAFSSPDPFEVVTSIYVKGGNTANLYIYPGNGIAADSNLHAPINHNGNQGSTGMKFYGLSHLCIFADKLSS